MKKFLFRLMWWTITLGWIVFLSAHIVRPSMINLGDKIVLILWGMGVPYTAYLIEYKILDTFE